MKLSSFFALLSLGAPLVSAQGEPANNTNVNVVVYPDCDIDDYYSGLSGTDPLQWTREELQALLQETHRGVLPVTGAPGEDDIYYAIMDLDRGNEVGKVRLVYRDVEMNAFPFADPNYWDVERLWSAEKGTDRPSPAFTDVHHIKPGDRTVQLKKKNENGIIITNFGMCDTVEFLDKCVQPATDETAETCAEDGKIWQPPVNSRGEIARALMYMDLRYQDLELRDCGPFNNAIGYLSQLLEWHAQYPVDDKERRRNSQACGRWQGNRNPFVDYPELAEALYGQPQEIISGQRTYPSCLDIPTQAPTAEPNECQALGEGNVPFFVVNTDDPDEVIFKALTSIPEGLELYLTDRAWNGTQFLEGVDDEGTVVLTVPEGGIQLNGYFGYGDSVPLGSTWQPEDGLMRFGDDGENLFLYCIDADDNIKFLSGFSNDETWKLPGLTAEEYGTTSSALPDALLNANILLVHRDNYRFNGTVEGSPVDQMRDNIRNPSLWDGDNDARFARIGDESGTWSWSIFASTAVTATTLLFGV